jgi:hypothetical protein
LSISITTSNKIEALDIIWDNFLPTNHHLKSKHLLAMQNAAINDLTYQYVQVFLKEELIGLIYLQQFTFTHQHINFKNDSKVWSKLLQLFLPKQLPILVCGHLFRINFQGFYFENVAHNHLVFDAIKLFTQQTKIPSGIIIKDSATIFNALHFKKMGFHFFDGDVTMEITKRATWLTYDDYLKSLHKKYLKRAKKITAAFEGIKIKLLDVGEIIQHKAAIEKLYLNVVNKQTIKLGMVNGNYFAELKKDLQHNFELYALYKNEIMVGFYTFIFYESTMETHFIGLDYEANKQHSIYFNILLLSINKMIEKQFLKLELGRTAREAKANVGATPTQIFNYINVKNRWAKITLNYFLNRFNTAENYSSLDRNPLK